MSGSHATAAPEWSFGRKHSLSDVWPQAPLGGRGHTLFLGESYPIGLAVPSEKAAGLGTYLDGLATTMIFGSFWL
ncbi:MAG: hypothetical protein NVS3B21_34350 [Acidimicrobiales bacterium]